MKAEKYLFKKWHPALLLIAGTVIRFIYGYRSQAWLAAPDQLAWQLGLDEMVNSGAWRYVQLVHAPHEGGGLFVSLLSLLFRPFQSIMPPLSWAALAIDTISRLIQLKTARKLWGDKGGIWTVLSVPLLLPWGTVNYGLHSLFSFIPFLYLYLILKYKTKKYLPVVCGLFCGIAVSLSYDSLVLVITSVFFLTYIAQTFTSRLSRWLVFFTTFILAVLPHVLTRIYFDPAFLPGTDGPLSIRGVPLVDVFSQVHLLHIFTVWFTSLPGSFLLSFPGFLPAGIIRIIVCLFFFKGFAGYITNKACDKHLKLLSIILVAVFVTAYASSPFYGSRYAESSYVYYRHWCYIIPLITVIMINGFPNSGKRNTYIAVAWISLCAVASLQYIVSAKKTDLPAYRATGWILAKKYGHNLDKLFQIHAMSKEQYGDELLVGYGWGLSAMVFKNRGDQAAIEEMVHMISDCPVGYQPAIIRGVYYSFNKGITPVLDQRLLEKLKFRLMANREMNR